MSNPTAKDVAAIVSHAGEIVGRTKLQKTAALLELAGVGAGFTFSYHHYGPYSEDLATAADRAVLLGLVGENPRRAAWGGHYSIFRAERAADPNPARAKLIDLAAGANAVTLELAVTAAFVADDEGVDDAWSVVADRKPEKASEANMKAAKELYRQFREVETERPLPAI